MGIFGRWRKRGVAESDERYRAPIDPEEWRDVATRRMIAASGGDRAGVVGTFGGRPDRLVLHLDREPGSEPVARIHGLRPDERLPGLHDLRIDRDRPAPIDEELRYAAALTATLSSTSRTRPLPDLAADALVAGYDAESLAYLAGLPRAEDEQRVVALFRQAVEDLGIMPDTDVLPTLLAAHVVGRLTSSELTSICSRIAEQSPAIDPDGIAAELAEFDGWWWDEAIDLVDGVRRVADLAEAARARRDQ